MWSHKFLSKVRKGKCKDVLVGKAIVKPLEGGEERTDAQEELVKILSISDDVSLG